MITAVEKYMGYCERRGLRSTCQLLVKMERFKILTDILISLGFTYMDCIEDVNKLPKTISKLREIQKHPDQYEFNEDTQEWEQKGSELFKLNTETKEWEQKGSELFKLNTETKEWEPKEQTKIRLDIIL